MATRTDVAEVDAKVDRVKAEIDGVKADVDGVKADVAEVDAKVEQVKADMVTKEDLGEKLPPARPDGARLQNTILEAKVSLIKWMIHDDDGVLRIVIAAVTALQ